MLLCGTLRVPSSRWWDTAGPLHVVVVAVVVVVVVVAAAYGVSMLGSAVPAAGSRCVHVLLPWDLIWHRRVPSSRWWDSAGPKLNIYYYIIS